LRPSREGKAARRSIAMHGISTFLLGGLVGAALGYLASRRKPQGVDANQADSLAETPSLSRVEPVEEPSSQPETAAVETTQATAVMEAPAEEVTDAELEAADGWAVAEVALEEPSVDRIVAEESPATEVPIEEPLEADLPAEETLGPEAAELVAGVVSQTEAVSVDSPPVSPIDDLKARIEETRRRIRQELEQPFVSTVETEDRDDWVNSPAVVSVDQTEDAPSTEAEQPDYDIGPMESSGDSSEEIVEEIDEEPSSGAVDYDSMKSRIESTRSRLKAKAFDAMMMGESALLSRDPQDVDQVQSNLPVVDSEIDQTIETSLREEEA